VNARRLLLRTVIAALCVTAGLAIVIVLSGNFDDTAGRILATTSAISVFALLIVPASILLERRIAVPVARASAVLTAAAFVVTLFLVWTASGGTPGWHWRAWGVLLTLAAAAAQAAGVEGRRRDTDSVPVSRLTTASMVTATILAALGAERRAAIEAWVESGGAAGRRGDLSGYDLRGANFAERNLVGLILRGADLAGANLAGATLVTANFEFANLQDANLEKADLRGANFRRARLDRALLDGSNLDDFRVPERVPVRTVFEHASLQGTRLDAAGAATMAPNAAA
jgi:hypothetical protein